MKKYNLPHENQNPDKVEEPAMTYIREQQQTELFSYTAERVRQRADQAIKDFENGLCISHEKITRK
ncbi:MAG: hypothetical protein LUG98_11190 [Tannerellaceae bacterium]|nr:hypothetical protein [Tannerellaceae bacterium]